MEKLIQFALATKFGEDNVNFIMQVITATPSPEVATEILLGLYERPEIDRTDEVLHYAGDDKTNIRYSMYDDFTKEVHFSYQRIIKSSAWFEKNPSGVVITSEEKIISDKYWAEDAARVLKMSTEDFNEKYERLVYHTEVEKHARNATKSVTDWNEYVQKCETFSHVEVTGGVML
jgi:hypothetical protein